MRVTDWQPEFVTLDVFTDQLYGGNPLAVFPGAASLTTNEMQQIAREFNLSETVFVLPAEQPGHCRRLRIFTPATELPFAGHPTIGAAHALAALGLLELSEDLPNEFIFEEGIGPVPVSIAVRSAIPQFCELTLTAPPESRPLELATATIAELLGLPADALGTDPGPAIWSSGVPYLCVPLRSRAALSRIRIDQGRWQAALSGAAAQALYAYVVAPEARLIHARMFAPALGVSEDPATGSAAAALTGSLSVFEQAPDQEAHWTILQGQDMGRPSRIELGIRYRAGRITRIRVGGHSVFVSRGRLVRPAPIPTA